MINKHAVRKCGGLLLTAAWLEEIEMDCIVLLTGDLGHAGVYVLNSAGAAQRLLVRTQQGERIRANRYYDNINCYWLRHEIAPFWLPSFPSSLPNRGQTPGAGQRCILLHILNDLDHLLCILHQLPVLIGLIMERPPSSHNPPRATSGLPRIRATAVTTTAAVLSIWTAICLRFMMTRCTPASDGYAPLQVAD